MRFSQWQLWRVLSAEIYCHVVCWKSPDILKERVASVFKVKEWDIQETSMKWVAIHLPDVQGPCRFIHAALHLCPLSAPVSPKHFLPVMASSQYFTLLYFQLHAYNPHTAIVPFSSVLCPPHLYCFPGSPLAALFRASASYPCRSSYWFALFYEPLETGELSSSFLLLSYINTSF
jgi:hypothetical protein